MVVAKVTAWKSYKLVNWTRGFIKNKNPKIKEKFLFLRISLAIRKTKTAPSPKTTAWINNKVFGFDHRR